MKNRLSKMVIFSFLILSACTSDQSSETIPELREKTAIGAPSCAADGLNCKQFNPEL